LDIGVIGATLALSALGATTVSSCNAGGFGGRHVAAFPCVAFFFPRDLADEVLAIAEEADVGLDLVTGGIARLYGGPDYDLHRFGQAALRRHAARRITQITKVFDQNSFQARSRIPSVQPAPGQAIVTKSPRRGTGRAR